MIQSSGNVCGFHLVIFKFGKSKHPLTSPTYRGFHKLVKSLINKRKCEHANQVHSLLRRLYLHVEC